MQPVNISELVRAIADGEERPFINLYWYQLLEVAKEDWDEVTTLYAVCSEARVRVMQNPDSKAHQVLEETQPQLERILESLLPPEPEGAKGYDELDAAGWPKIGVLKRSGYTVGRDDPGEVARRDVLQRVFQQPVPLVFDPVYVAEWGRDGSAKRLRKMAWSIATFCVNRLRANRGEDDALTLRWRRDLDWLRVTFYEGYFGFPWPSVDLPKRLRGS